MYDVTSMSPSVRRNADSCPFISYAREDASIAKRVFDDLALMGASPWLDTEKLLGGQDWKREVRQAIRNSSHFVALISRHSVSKQGYVQSELRQALDVLDECPPDRVFVIPVRLDATEPAHERLRDLNWVDLLPNYDVGIKKLALSLGVIPPTLSDSVSRSEAVDARKQSYLETSVDPDETAVTVDVREIVKSVVDSMQRSAATRNIELVLRLTPRAAPATIPSDALRVAVYCLIDNAIKYSVVPDVESPQGRPWVSVSVRSGVTSVTISVESWGIPFTRLELENGAIFRAGHVGIFARQLNVASSGLGLSAVKRVADQSGGTVKIFTDPVVGAGGVERRCTIVSLRMPKAGVNERV